MRTLAGDDAKTDRTADGSPNIGGEISRRKIGLRLALTALVLATVTVTSLAVHLSWSYTARENVSDVVGQLNKQIVDSVHHEVRGVLNDAWAMQEAVRSIFFQGAIKVDDEGKREFVFLALLRSQPSLSWISLGFPNGDFFGSHKVSDTEIDMVAIRRDPEKKQPVQRVDYYKPDVGDILFLNREIQPGSYDATAQPWYSRAVAENGPGWNHSSHYPTSDRQSFSTSTPLIVDNHVVAVINVVIESARLSEFLESVTVGKTGTVVILDSAGRVVAAADPAAVEQQQAGSMPALARLGRANPLFDVVEHELHREALDLASLTATRQRRVTGGDGIDYFVTLAPLRFDNWVVATVIPASDFLATIERNAQMLLAGLAVLTALMAIVAIIVANRLITSPLLRVVGQLRHVESFDLDGITRVPSAMRELDDLSMAMTQMARGLASFQKYMPTALVRTLVSRGVEARPGGREQELTVLFIDITGFTSLSERLGDNVVPVLTEYLELTSHAILSQHGTIDKFIGDAVMAFWGAPVPSERHAVEACAAALECQRRMRGQRDAAERDGRDPLYIRIGINTGTMLVGNIGSSERLNYTVIGDPVNVASRLEAINKRYGTEILIGEDTRRAAGDAVIVRRVDRVAVYGRLHGVAIFELLAMAEEGPVPSWVASYEHGLDAYGERNWPAAIAFFEEAVRRRGADRPAEIFIARCREFLVVPPPASWTPLTMLDAK